jgi:hypothetical protein
MKLRSLKELGALRDALAAAQREAAQQEVRLRLQHARAERERVQLTRADRERHQVFAHAVGPVTPLLPHGRADLRRQPPAAHARQRELDEQAALHEAMSDEVDVESLLLTDDGLSCSRGCDAGIGRFSASSICTACGARRRGRRCRAFCAKRINRACAACA